MGARGRAGTAALSVVSATFQNNRPDSPPGLTSDQAEIWSETVATEAAGFFGTAALRSLLAEYCRHTATAGLVSSRIDEFDISWLSDDEGLKRYDLLLKMRDRETKAAADKATKLRLTNQSRYTPQSAATAAKHTGGTIKKPWE